MLTQLGIENYALINALHIDFSRGLTIVTGETGAGKSILMGALSLILGQRAGAEVLRSTSKACTIEASFILNPAAATEAVLRDLFASRDMEYSPEIEIRRMIMPGGKNRCFVNDEPAGLSFLKELAPFLVDIHAQHKNLLLEQPGYQLRILDIFAQNTALLDQYRDIFCRHSAASALYEQMRDKLRRSEETADFLQFRLNRLQEAKLEAGEQEALEEELQVLTHSAEIKQDLYTFTESLSDGEDAILSRISELKSLVSHLSQLYPPFESVPDRWNSLKIEIQDIASDAASALEKVDLDPGRMEEVQTRLDYLYSLMQQMHCQNVEELIDLRDSLSRQTGSLEDEREALEAQKEVVASLESQRNAMAMELHRLRQEAAPVMSAKMVSLLQALEIPHARVECSLQKNPGFDKDGCTTVEWMFSANLQMEPSPLAKVASGGELSRIMLCVKYLLAQHAPTACLVFDEIDLGVSGRTADKIGEMINALAQNMQVIAISHLPQVASKGNNHFLVYKQDSDGATISNIRRIEGSQRVDEIARLLSGASITPQARAQAEVLLNFK